jgi:hypothetical protein
MGMRKKLGQTGRVSMFHLMINIKGNNDEKMIRGVSMEVEQA